MNYDDFEPASEFDSYGTENGGFYSTGSQPQRHHTGAIVVLSLLVILCCTVGTLLSVFQIRLERSNGRVALYVTSKDKEIAAIQDSSQRAGIRADSRFIDRSGPAREETGVPTLQLSPTQSGSYAQTQLPDVYRKVIPSVVSILTVDRSGAATASGTGIIMSEDGYIITNCHVIENGGAIGVLLQDNTEYVAEVVGSDELTDLAVLRIEATGLTPAEFGDSEQLEVGEQVVAIGDPLGIQLRGTMTDGIVSAINRDLTYERRTLTLIQTNAALNSGNSGGPLVNLQGQVIGINTVKISTYYTAGVVEGLGFAIPITSAKAVIDELIRNGYVSGRPAIGISGQPVPAAAQAYYGLPAGVYVENVDPDSDAYARGVRPGDIITALEDVPVDSAERLNEVKNRFGAGDTVTLTVFRSGRLYNVDVTLTDMAAD